MGQQSLLQVADVSEHVLIKSDAGFKGPPFARINLPNRKRRDRLKELERASPRESFVEADVETASEASSEQDYSYEFAQMEVMMKTLGSNGTMGIICPLGSTLSFVLSGHSCMTVGGPRIFPATPTIFPNCIICSSVYSHYSKTLLFLNLPNFNLDNHNSLVLMFNQPCTVVSSALTCPAQGSLSPLQSKLWRMGARYMS